MFEAAPVTSLSGNGDVPASSDHPPEPGELKLKERRSWRTWQLLLAVLVAAIFGMWINGDTGGGASSATSSTSGTLPPASGSSAAGSTTTTAAAGGSTTTTAAGGSTTNDGRRRIHHDHCRRRIHDDVDHIVDLDGPGGTRTGAPGVSAAQGQLDQHLVHDDCRSMEHRLGVQLCSCPGRRSIVPGVRDSGGVGSHGYARDRRDRSIRTVGHCAVQPGGADARGAGPGRVYLDRQGRPAPSPVRPTTLLCWDGRPTPRRWTAIEPPGGGDPECPCSVSRTRYIPDGRWVVDVRTGPVEVECGQMSLLRAMRPPLAHHLLVGGRRRRAGNASVREHNAARAGRTTREDVGCPRSERRAVLRACSRGHPEGVHGPLAGDARPAGRRPSPHSRIAVGCH